MLDPSFHAICAYADENETDGATSLSDCSQQSPHDDARESSLYTTDGNHYKSSCCSVTTDSAESVGSPRWRGRLIGIATGTDAGYVMTFGIHSTYRRKGLGSLLIRALMKQLECGYIYLDVHEANEAALRFYQKVGFAFEYVMHNHYIIKGKGENAWRLSIRDNERLKYT